MELNDWTRDEPAGWFDLWRSRDTGELRRRYGSEDRVFGELLRTANRIGARSLLAEYRYIDADYRSEHTLFYGSTYVRYPSITHRLHFFTGEPRDEGPFEQDDYIGYSVVRPVAASPVGRTMLRPPPDLAAAVSCKTTDSVNLYGTRLEVEGAPFIAQDSQLNVCAHAAAWMVCHYHHLRFGEIRRWTMGEVVEASPTGVARDLPSTGLTVPQLGKILHQVGLPPLVYDLGALPGNESLEAVICRYLNSQLPVIVAGDRHAFVIVGYRSVPDEAGGTRVEFIRHDDRSGGYQEVPRHADDNHKPWRNLVVPLPSKVYMSGEGAESLGRVMLGQLLAAANDEEAKELERRLEENDPQLRLRTSAHRSNDLKDLLRTHRSTTASQVYDWHWFSRWVWLVEVVEEGPWTQGEPSVRAEVILDATAHSRDHRVLAWRIPGEVGRWLTDFGKPDREPSSEGLATSVLAGSRIGNSTY